MSKPIVHIKNVSFHPTLPEGECAIGLPLDHYGYGRVSNKHMVQTSRVLHKYMKDGKTHSFETENTHYVVVD